MLFSEKPLVSVYIPTHNRSNLLVRAIDSVLAQSYKNVEIIVCSDGSKDDTDIVMKQYCQKNHNIVYLKNDSPQGACAARNKAINAAKGEYITGLDDDDVFHPLRIELLLDLYDDDKSFICSSLFERDLTQFDHPSFFAKSLGKTEVKEVTLDAVFLDNIVGNQIFTKTAKLKEIGGFDVEMPAWQDYDTWVRMLLKFGNGTLVNSVLYIADIDRNISRITHSPNRIKGCTKFYDRYWQLMSETNQNNAIIRKAIFKNQKLTVKELIIFFNIKAFKNWARAVAIKLGHKF